MFRSMVMVYRRTRTRIITELKFKQRPEIKIFGFSLIFDFLFVSSRSLKKLYPGDYFKVSILELQGVPRNMTVGE